MPDDVTTDPDAWTTLVDAHNAAAVDHDGSFPEHRPVAAVLACSDARVPPSLIFGQPAGNLFVVRLAGNSATAGAVASLTYAVEQLGVDLVIVLGHTGCGAVTAALSPDMAPELRAVLDPIDEMLSACQSCDDVDAAVTANVRHNLTRIRRERGPLGSAVTTGRVALRGAVHDLRSGRLIDVTPTRSSITPTNEVPASPSPANPSPANPSPARSSVPEPIRS
jgi:carbonic anhydrase